jgi:hypothetical protein
MFACPSYPLRLIVQVLAPEVHCREVVDGIYAVELHGDVTST